MKVLLPFFERIEEYLQREKAYWEDLSILPHIKVAKPFLIPGVPENSTILIFAGNTGEDSTKLKAKKFIFTDLVAKRVKIAKQNSSKEFRKKTDFMVCDAYHVPLKDDSVDFSFSFEPYPLFELPYFLPELIRCTKKGIVFAYFHTESFSDIISNLKKIAEKYWLRQEILSVPVVASILTDNLIRVNFKIEIYHITKFAKQKAAVDSKVMKISGKVIEERHGLSRESLEKVRKRAGLNKKEFTDSLKRITFIMDRSPRDLTLEADY